jgi:hypothetical protein
VNTKNVKFVQWEQLSIHCISQLGETPALRDDQISVCDEVQLTQAVFATKRGMPNVSELSASRISLEDAHLGID